MKAIQHTYQPSYQADTSKSLITKFFDWCKSQEQYRLGWLAGGITGHGCLITPATLVFVMMGGNSPVLWAFVMAAMGMTLVTNLAALPTRITIPVLFLSILIDIVVILNCLS